jgi:ribosomal protein S27E
LCARGCKGIARVVNRLRCEDCGTVFYSAAARTLVELGETCAKCGGILVIENGPGPLAVSGPTTRDGNGDES